MTILFISDLHLEEQHPETTEIFFKFLKSEALSAKALYILGDFFEIWIGDDDLSPYNQKIIESLRVATHQGLPIYFTHGNRDFLIGRKFLRATGCRLLPEECVVNLYSSPTLLMHGDTLCLEDIKYLQFRKKARNWFCQKYFLFKSLEKRRELAAKMRTASREHTRTSADYIMDITQTEVERVMQKHKVQHLIHGHTHRQAVHRFELNGQAATRTVLGAWHGKGNVLICKENGEQELIALD